jgi:hypothetical protein
VITVIAFKNLKEILQITVKWEKKLKDFYDVAEFALRNKDSKQVVVLLRENLLNRLDVLKKINLDDYGKTEWVRYAPDYKDSELIPVQTISRDADPVMIFTQILEYEQKLRDFYKTIHDKLVVSKQKDLFESLVKFKNEQIFEINSFTANFPPKE